MKITDNAVVHTHILLLHTPNGEYEPRLVEVRTLARRYLVPYGGERFIF